MRGATSANEGQLQRLDAVGAVDVAPPPAGRATASVRVGPDGSRAEVAFFDAGPEPGLFGCTHRSAVAPAAGVVICSPLDAEWVRNYRKEFLLANALAAAGIAVQRFHYRGQGNSGGDEADLTFDTMVADAVAAGDRLRRQIGVHHLAFVGTRLGSLVAARAATTMGGPLALWEPVADPAEFFHQLFRAQIILELRHGRRLTRHELQTRLETEGRIDILGYPLHLALYATIVDLSLVQELRTLREPLLWVHARPAGLPRDQVAVIEELRASGSSVEVHATEGVRSWWFIGEDHEWRADESRAEILALIGDTVRWFRSRFGDQAG